jgi:hypothetical protein
MSYLNAIKEFRENMQFSTHFAVLRLKKMLAVKFRTEQLILDKIDRNENEYIYDFLKKELTPIIHKYKQAMDGGVYNNNSQLPIWICWLGGIKQMPDIVQICVNSVYEMRGGIL